MYVRAAVTGTVYAKALRARATVGGSNHKTAETATEQEAEAGRAAEAFMEQCLLSTRFFFDDMKKRGKSDLNDKR